MAHGIRDDLAHGMGISAVFGKYINHKVCLCGLVDAKRLDAIKPSVRWSCLCFLHLEFAPTYELFGVFSIGVRSAALVTCLGLSPVPKVSWSWSKSLKLETRLFLSQEHLKAATTVTTTSTTPTTTTEAL